MTDPVPSANIAQHLPLMAARQPDVAALKIPRGRRTRGDGATEIDYLTLTFAELDVEVAAWAARLGAAGVRTDDRVLVMVRQGLPLIAAVFALFSIGAVPIVIDPGMGLKNFLACVERSRPRALLGIPVARFLSRVCRRAFSTVDLRVAASANPLAQLTAGSKRETRKPKPAAVAARPVARVGTDLAAILFTSGSTGAPKGVCYEHGMFAAQVDAIRAAYAIQPGEIDLPMLPIFALFNPALGMTTIVPELDPRRPAAVDPAKIVQAIRQENVTNSFGSPTLWTKIVDHCLRTGETLPSLRRVLCAGAPVPTSLWENSTRILTGGELHSPYGATEALPIASLSQRERAALQSPAPNAQAPTTSPASARAVSGDFFGSCVGRPLPGADVKIIAINDAPIAALADARELPLGEIGEIILRGPVVTKQYDALPAATAAAKIRQSGGKFAAPSNKFQEATGAAALSPATSPWALDPFAAGTAAIWHRMGDCGYLDGDGRFWFCGRKAERVVTAHGPLFTEPVEHVFRTHPAVARCALIGLRPPGGEDTPQTPALVVQPREKLSAAARRVLAAQLRALAAAHAHTAAITHFYFHPAFPVDVRHNAKIHRLTLARWAAAHPREACRVG
jgi:acyl-CoA synthetase (AMP-forming)/AMP-acid ligase II